MNFNEALQKAAAYCSLSEKCEYEVKEKKVLKYNDKQAIESLYEKSDNNQLILYTCYRISMIGLTEDRLFVYAARISGKMIDLDN